MENNNMSIAKEILSWVKEIVIVVAVVYFIITFVGQNTRVIGQSMEKALQDGNSIIINKFIYRFAKPARGDIIVFPYRGNPKKDYIKRIVGLPGDKIEILNQKVYINGMPFDEPYIKEPIKEMGNVSFPFVVPENEYFVMGDNRNNSYDSRYKEVGTIPLKNIIGKASLRIWPLNKFGFVH